MYGFLTDIISKSVNGHRSTGRLDCSGTAKVY